MNSLSDLDTTQTDLLSSFSTVMTTPELVNFYRSQTQNKDVLPRRLENFTIIVGNPGDMGSKGGIKILQLHDPGLYGKVEVKGHSIKTSNIMSLEFDVVLWQGTITINGAQLMLGETMALFSVPMNIYNIGTEESFATSQKEATMSRRYGRQLGSMTAILHTKGHFIIQHPGLASTSHVALQVSRNLHQYFQADTAVFPSFSDPRLSNTSGNIITLAISNRIPHLSPYFPIRITNAGCSVRNHEGEKQEFGENARGAAFLRSAGGERLELVIWGADEEGLQQAARIVPMLTGVGQPDFVVVGKSAKWRGIEGVLAMGFFDAKWRVTASSVVETV
jgi:hypothetical protein